MDDEIVPAPVDVVVGAMGGHEEGDEEISADETKLLETLRLLGIKPKLESPAEVLKLVQLFGTMKHEGGHTSGIGDSEPKSRSGTYHFPKLSTFYGEEGKGEVTWVTFKYEVEALIIDKVFSPEQMLLGMRRALKGTASDKVRRLGPGATLEQILEKLENDYGTVESKESVMRRFYSCQQKSDETVEHFASRIEDLFDQAVRLKALIRTDNSILKEILHAGLKRDLKHMSMYQHDKSKGYEEFKRELRKMEADLNDNGMATDRKTCKAAVSTEKKESTEFSEIKQLLLNMNVRLETLEKGKDERPQQRLEAERRLYRGRGVERSMGRGGGHNMNRGRGRGDFRPTADTTFQPICHICNEKGHIHRYCPHSFSVPLVCYNCNGRGHMQKDCPVLLGHVTCYNCKEKGHKANKCPNV